MPAAATWAWAAGSLGFNEVSKRRDVFITRSGGEVQVEYSLALIREDGRTTFGSDAQLIGDFYASCIDEAAIEKAGIEPLKPFLHAILVSATLHVYVSQTEDELNALPTYEAPAQ